MNRRDFLKVAGLGVAASALAACAEPAPAAGNAATEDLPVLDWQMATSWSTGLDILFGATQKFAEHVKALTGGKFTITPRAGGELGTRQTDCARPSTLAETEQRSNATRPGALDAGGLCGASGFVRIDWQRRRRNGRNRHSNTSRRPGGATDNEFRRIEVHQIKVVARR